MAVVSAVDGAGRSAWESAQVMKRQAVLNSALASADDTGSLRATRPQFDPHLGPPRGAEVALRAERVDAGVDLGGLLPHCTTVRGTSLGRGGPTCRVMR